MTPIILMVLLLRSDSAIRLGLKLCSRANSVIFLRVSSLILGLPFSARETVATETLNSRAMSFIVIGALLSVIVAYLSQRKITYSQHIFTFTPYII